MKPTTKKRTSATQHERYDISRGKLLKALGINSKGVYGMELLTSYLFFGMRTLDDNQPEIKRTLYIKVRREMKEI